jgi:hypothetical protein
MRLGASPMSVRNYQTQFATHHPPPHEARLTERSSNSKTQHFRVRLIELKKTCIEFCNLLTHGHATVEEFIRSCVASELATRIVFDT